MMPVRVGVLRGDLVAEGYETKEGDQDDRSAFEEVQLKSQGSILKVFLERLHTDPVELFYSASGYGLFLFARLIWRMLIGWRFASFGAGSSLIAPRLISGAKYIRIGDHVTIRPGARIEAIRWVGSSVYNPMVSIGAGCFFEFDFQLSCAKSVTIGRDVLAGGRVFITDNSHGKKPGAHRLRQPLDVAPVHIGDYVWLGQGAIVLPGVTVGDSSIIAAGAVVTKSCPPGTILAGVPARPIGNVPVTTVCNDKS